MANMAALVCKSRPATADELARGLQQTPAHALDLAAAIARQAHNLAGHRSSGRSAPATRLWAAFPSQESERCLALVCRTIYAVASRL